MPKNENPRVKELLSWHSHDRGGVHVPFQAAGNPFGSVIVTGLIQKLRGLARSLAAGEVCPRWIFLVGGPGNGKSETVEDFLRQLDVELGMGGALRAHLAAAFSPAPLVPRRVEVTSSNLSGSLGTFAQRVGRLIVVQDATATDNAFGNAAKQLATDVLDLLTTPETPVPVFVACTNRGLLARALKEAFIDFKGASPATRLFSELIRASSLGLETFKGTRLICWPLPTFSNVACWPLDQEGLLSEGGGGPSPVDQMLTRATELPVWESPGRCADCDAAAACPFRQNAEWLRDSGNRASLAKILRHGELATGQRWNFRGSFSLVAELLVGEWGDFGDIDHPCKWVHAEVEAMGDLPVPESVGPAYHLLRRLYPHVLFPTAWLQPIAERLEEEPGGFADEPITEAVVAELSVEPGDHPKPIREKLLMEYGRFDPTAYTPTSLTHVLHKIETEYSQSVKVGNSVLRTPDLARAEKRFLECLRLAEEEWDLLGRESARAARLVHLLRRAASIVVKQSVGVRLGHHAFELELDAFSATLRNTQKLNQLKDALQQLLGKDEFRFNLVESYGQPAAEEDSLVTLEGPKPGLRTFPAPTSTPAIPGHDVPCFSIGSSTDYRMPITFDFFLALSLRAAGCANSSLPASVRASIDRVRHRYAGELCRDTEKFANSTAKIVVGGKAAITLADDNMPPTVSPI